MPARIQYNIGFSIEDIKILKAQQAIKNLEGQLAPFRTQQHFQQLTKELEQFQEKANRPGWFNGLQEGIRNVTGQIPIVGDLLGGLLSGAVTPLLAVTAAVAAMKTGYSEAAEAEQKLIALDQALANRNALTPQSRQQFHSQAEEIETKTGLKDEQIMGVQTKLLQFGAPTDDVTKLTAGIIDLAGALGGDIDRASMIYVRALAGSFTAAHKLGLEIDKTGSSSQQMAQLLSESARVGGGALERLHDSSKGAWTDMANEWRHTFQGLGRDIKPFGDGIAKLLGKLTKLEPWQIGLPVITPGEAKKIMGIHAPEAGEPEKTKNRPGGGITEQLDDDLGGLTGGAGTAKTALDRLIEDLAKFAEMAEKIRRAELSESMGTIRRDEASGAITKEEAAKRAAQAQAESERDAAREQIQQADAQLPLLAQKRIAAEKNLADEPNEHRQPMLQEKVREVNMQIQGVVASREAATIHLRAADVNETAGVTGADQAARRRRDKADEERLKSEADAAESAAKNFIERRAALALKHAAELKAIQDEIDQGHKTPEEIKALEAKRDATKKKNVEDDRKLNEQQISAQDRLTKLQAETLTANARTPSQQRAAIVAERNADLGALKHQQAAETDTDKKNLIGAQIDLVTAQYSAKLREFDMQHTHLDQPKTDVDHFAKIGLFVGGQAPVLDYQKRTAEATMKLAAWVAAGAPVNPKGAGPQPGRFS